MLNGQRMEYKQKKVHLLSAVNEILCYNKRFWSLCIKGRHAYNRYIHGIFRPNLAPQLTFALVTSQKPTLPSFLRKKETSQLPVLGKCPTTQPSFIMATMKGFWGLVSSLVSLSVSPTVGNQMHLYLWHPLNVRRPHVASTFANNLTSGFPRQSDLYIRQYEVRTV